MSRTPPRPQQSAATPPLVVGKPAPSVSAGQPDPIPQSPGTAMPAGIGVVHPNFPPMPVGHVQEFRVPSNGIPYSRNGTPLLPDGLVYIRAMTGLEEMVLNSPALSEQAKIARIVALCTIFPRTGITHKHLTAMDRLLLLFAIRKYSFGSQYKITATCPHCDMVFDANIDIGNMDVSEMPRTEKDENGNVIRTYTFDAEEGIPCTLSNGMEMRLRLISGEDEDFVLGEIKKGTASKYVPPIVHANGIDIGTFLRTLLSIYKYQPSPGAELVPFDFRNPATMQSLANLYFSLPAKDTIAIDLTYSRHDVSIDNTVQTKCARCSEEVRVPIVLTPGFLRPTDSDR